MKVSVVGLSEAAERVVRLVKNGGNEEVELGRYVPKKNAFELKMRELAVKEHCTKWRSMAVISISRTLSFMTLVVFLWRVLEIT